MSEEFLSGGESARVYPSSSPVVQLHGPAPTSPDAFAAFNLANFSPESLAIIRRSEWKRFGLEVTIAIARAWNGGHGVVEIGAAAGCSPGSISTTIGKLRSIGLDMREPPNVPKTKAPALEARGPRVENEAFRERVIDVRRPARGDVTRQILGDPPPGRTPWSAA